MEGTAGALSAVKSAASTNCKAPPAMRRLPLTTVSPRIRMVPSWRISSRGDRFTGGTNVFTGTTIISNGTLLVNGVLSTNATSTVTVATNATLGGTGVINSATTMQGGGALAPGTNGIGTLTVSNNVSLLDGSRTLMELSKNGGVLTNDLVFITGTLTQGGTLIVTNIGTHVLVAGDSFQLFSAGIYAGGFAAFSLPVVANGLCWNTNTLAT